MELNLVGKKVLVTGASRGIGLQIARQFSTEGCMVAMNARNDIPSELIDAVNRSIFIKGDVSNEVGAKDVVDRCATTLDGLDVVICNVGSGRSVRPGQENIKAWKDAFDVNFYSATCVIEAAKPYLQRSQGVVICISSICGNEVIPGAPVTYSVTKAALNAYVKGISRPLGAEGIRICAISPGNVLFKGSVWDLKMQENPDEVAQMLSRDVPLQKLAGPEDIANLAVFLASPISNNSTGSIWTVDGGQTRA